MSVGISYTFHFPTLDGNNVRLHERLDILKAVTGDDDGTLHVRQQQRLRDASVTIDDAEISLNTSDDRTLQRLEKLIVDNSWRKTFLCGCFPPFYDVYPASTD